MRSLIEKAKAWSADVTVRGLVPWVLLLIVLIALNQRYTIVQSNFTKTVQGLETRQLYLRDRMSEICVGDMVHYRSAERKSKYFKKVMGGAGTVLTLTETGYRIGETDHLMKPEWLTTAREQMGERADLTVPDGHVLFVNPEHKPGDDYNGWAFESAPRANITDRLTHVLFSRNFSRIGDPVGTADPDCQR